MRVVLFSGLTALLAGLVALGAVLIADRRTKPIAPIEDEPDAFEPPRPAPSRSRPAARWMPSVPSAACAPKPGRACWRGRLRLTEAVRKAWGAARVAQSAAIVDSAGVDGVDEITVVDESGQARRIGVHAVDDTDDTDEPKTNGSVVGQEGVDTETDGDPSSSSNKPIRRLPPDGSFAAFFSIRAVSWDDQPDVPGGDGAISDRAIDGEEGEEIEDVVTHLAPDGTFDLDIAPGRYDLEVISKDEILLGGIDGLTARAGETRAGLDLMPAFPVAIAGRVLDDDNVGVDATLDVRRAHHDEEGRSLLRQDGGRFEFAGLRPGPYVVTASVGDGQSQSIEIRAPLDGITLRVTRLPTALLLVAPTNDGQCPQGKVVLTSQDQRRERRAGSLAGCQSVIRGVRPGSTWRAIGKVGGRPIDRMVNFGFGKPVAPVCLDGGCRPQVAAIDVRVVDSGGDRVDAVDIEVLDGRAAGPPSATFIAPFTPGLRAGDTLRLRARAGGSEATASVWLAPGVNDVVIRLPDRLAGRG